MGASLCRVRVGLIAVWALAAATGLNACGNDDDNENMFNGSTAVNVTADSVVESTRLPAGTTTSSPFPTTTTPATPDTSIPSGTVSPQVGAKTPGPTGTTPVSP
jgi:hypothetical protein